MIGTRIESPGPYFPTQNPIPMKTSKDFNAKPAIEEIEKIESQAELDAFVTSAEDRKTVLAARDKRFAELTDGSDQTTDPEASDSPAVVDSDEPDTSSDEEQAAEVVTISGLEYNQLAKAVSTKLAEETIRFANGVFPEGSNEQAIKQLAAQVFTIAEEDRPDDDEDVSVPADAWGELVIKLQAQLVIYKSRRGLSTPSKIDQNLIKAVELVSEEE